MTEEIELNPEPLAGPRPLTRYVHAQTRLSHAAPSDSRQWRGNGAFVTLSVGDTAPKRSTSVRDHTYVRVAA